MNETTWPNYQSRVTVIDVLESGACIEGVKKWIVANRGVIAGETAKQSNENILSAANADGNGNGYGYGNGDGYGDG